MAGNNYTKIKDLVTGSEGTAYITVDGQNRYFFELSKIDATVEFTVIARKLLGHRMKQHKVTAAEAKVPVAYLEDGSEDLNTTDTDFTFDDLDDLESYTLPENMR